MFNILSEIKDLKVSPSDISSIRWSKNDVDWVLEMLPEPRGTLLGLEYPKDWRMKMFTEAMETERATIEFVDPALKIVYKLVLEYEGNGKFKFMNIPECFHNYDGPMCFEIDERHLKLHRPKSLMDYRDVNINATSIWNRPIIPSATTCWGTTLKATTQGIKKLYEISEENIIIALKKLCEENQVCHAGLSLSLGNYTKAIVLVKRENGSHRLPRMFVIDNNVLEEIIAAPMPEIKKKPKKPSKPTTPREPSLSELLSGLSGGVMFNPDTFK